MCLLFETIRIADGEPLNLRLHQERFNLSRYKLFGINVVTDLSDYLKIPDRYKSGLVRCRIIYGRDFESVEYTTYLPAKVNTLKLVDGNHIRYDHKFLDRTLINKLIDKETADDVLIIRNGCITDASFANIVFSDGERWVTPEDPLLQGTMRRKLLNEGVIKEQRITVEDLGHFTHFKLINAMLAFSSPAYPIENIH